MDSCLFIRSNSYGTPFFTSLLSSLERITKSVYVGYMNGDLLLHSSFLESLQTIHQEQVKGILPKAIMAMGRRTNIGTTLQNDYTSFSRQQFDSLIERNSSFTDMFISVAQDFFIYNHGKMNLHDYPLSKLVIGRNAYDNYMVDYCIKNDIKLIDISQSSNESFLM